MIEMGLRDKALIVRAADGDLRPRHESQLAYWGFHPEPGTGSLIASQADLAALAAKLVTYFRRHDLCFDLQPSIQALIEEQDRARTAIQLALRRCSDLKNGVLDQETAQSFVAFAEGSISRPLKQHQIKAALHLMAAENGANFSVPGSGKTAVVLSAFSYLKHCDCVDSLFVVGPPACFGPWRTEYTLVLGAKPKYDILAGGE